MKRLGPVGRKHRRLVRKIKALLDEHDRAEIALIQATRRMVAGRTRSRIVKVMLLWTAHDTLERKIIVACARLPQPLVEMLKQGEL